MNPCVKNYDVDFLPYWGFNWRPKLPKIQRPRSSIHNGLGGLPLWQLQTGKWFPHNEKNTNSRYYLNIIMIDHHHHQYQKHIYQHHPRLHRVHVIGLICCCPAHSQQVQPAGPIACDDHPDSFLYHHWDHYHHSYYYHCNQYDCPFQRRLKIKMWYFLGIFLANNVAWLADWLTGWLEEIHFLLAIFCNFFWQTTLHG